uniref:T cell receptor gamma variable 9 n=1 Tax=Catagonus wagneri TaxID=51154 RepID=A0A8C3YI35_9CETA
MVRCPGIFGVCLLTSFFPPVCVDGVGHLDQPQLSRTKTQSKTAHLECVVSAVTISSVSVYWYQERPDQTMQHLLHISSENTVKMELDIALNKSETDKVPKTSTLTLTIHSVGEQDSATYYCALWEVHSGRH